MMIAITQIELLPRISGVYKVIDAEGTVIYVGQAKNIYRRWKNGHHILSEILIECGTDAYIDWVEVPEWLLNRTENAAITFYQPKLNKKKAPVI